jgi:MoxR-like ATPase
MKLLMKTVGRQNEFKLISACLKLDRNVLLEGPVGVGKTVLALEVASQLNRPLFRIDGDSRFTEQKLTGWFDPPLLVEKGYSADSFIPGPLVQAMQQGGILFINELNRLPEGVQNVLLPALDEGLIQVPRLGEIRSKPGFAIIATQNPKEFVATSHLSEALLDRFELVSLDFLSETEEVEILVNSGIEKAVSNCAVQICRLTRNHPQIRRGASIRAMLGLAKLFEVLSKEIKNADLKLIEKIWLDAAELSLLTRIEFNRESSSHVGASAKEEKRSVLKSIVLSVLSNSEKKKQ